MANPLLDKPKYLEFYGLEEPPYSTNTDPKFLYDTQQHTEALRLCGRIIDTKQGAGLIIGETGTGKTTLLKKAAKLLMSEPDAYKVGVIVNPGRISSTFQFIKEVMESFGQECVGRDLKTRYDQFDEFITGLNSQSVTPILLVDEAQHLKPSTLEDLRGVLNMETNQGKLLQMILFAMPSIKKRLPYAPSFANRIKLFTVNLDKIDRKDTESLLRHRFNVAGGDLFPFDEKAVNALYKKSEGNPRLICGAAQLALELAGNSSQFVSAEIINQVFE